MKNRSWRSFVMNYWLLKSEPNVWSIDQQLKVGAKGADWDGVRNKLSSRDGVNNLKKMKKMKRVIFVFFIIQILVKKSLELLK